MLSSFAIRLAPCLLLAIAASLSLEARGARIWQNKSGKFTVEAELIQIKGQSVHLVRKDGKVISVELNELSKADQLYVADVKKQDDQRREDPQRIQGYWKVVLALRNGMPDDAMAPKEISLSGGQLMFLPPAGPPFVYRLTPDQQRGSGTMDFMPPGAPDSMKLIYALVGDRLTLCSGLNPSHPRPDDFDTQRGTQRLLLVLERRRPGERGSR